MKGAINLHNIVSETECLVVKAQRFPPLPTSASAPTTSKKSDPYNN